MDIYEFKLDQARELLKLMCSAKEDRKAFLLHLTSFLTAARSVLLYGEEQSIKLKQRSNYDALLERYPIVDSFRRLRNKDVHRRPVIPNAHSNTMIIDVVVATSEIIELADNDDRWKDPDFDLWPSVEVVETITHHSTDYYFSDMPNHYTVIGHCSGYLGVIEQVIKEATASGFIAP